MTPDQQQALLFHCYCLAELVACGLRCGHELGVVMVAGGTYPLDEWAYALLDRQPWPFGWTVLLAPGARRVCG